MNSFMQKLGKSLMLPIAVLPICGILMGIGYLIYPQVMQNGEVIGFWKYFSFLLVKTGSAVIYNIPWLFVIGVSLGMSDDNHGAACLSGLVSWLVLITLLSTEVTSSLFKNMTKDSIQFLAFSKIQNPFIAILAGLVGAISYNKFKNIKLPEVLAFFSGRRFVAIATVFFSIILSGILLFIWPLLFRGLALLGNLAVGMGAWGAGIYAFFNRLLIPSGLHHVLNNIFWFDTIGIGDLTNYWAGKTSADVSWSLGMYMSGLFPCMMFGIPGAALAMYRSAKNKKMALGILLSASLCSIICGLTEPFEFIFLFTAFPLYVVYSLLYGLFYIITYYVGFRGGLSFSGGLVDFLCSSTLPAATNTWMIIPLGFAAFVIFYLVFRFSIVKFKLPIFDQESSVLEISSNVKTTEQVGSKYEIMAYSIYKALGGKTNIVSVDCCATRLRLELKNSSIIDELAIKNAGALGVRKTSPKSIQIIIGMTVQQVCEALKNIVDGVTNETISSNCILVKHGEIINNPWNETKFKYVIKDKIGIHVRPAGKLAKLVKTFNVTVILKANGKIADATNITDVMYLGASTGTEVTVEFDGIDANKAFTEVKSFFENNL